MHYYQRSVEEVLKTVESNPEGLSAEAAHERRRHDGPNELPSLPKRHDFRRYAAYAAEPFTVFLLAAAFMAFAIDFSLVGYALAALLVLNIGLMLSRDFAPGPHAAFAGLLPETALVRRGGKLHHVPASELALGDIVLIQHDETVPADLRLTEVDGLQIDTSPVINEPQPFEAFTHELSGHVAPEHRHNIALQGATVRAGKGVGVVIATTPHTTLAQAATISASASKPITPLERATTHLNLRMAQAVAAFGVLAALAGLLSGLTFEQTSWFIIAVAVVLLPLTLPLLTSLSLTYAVQRFKNMGVRTRRLSAPDTLGTVDILVLDTERAFNKRSVKPSELLIAQERYRLHTGNDPNVTDAKNHRLYTAQLEEFKLFFVASLFASNAPETDSSRKHYDTALRQLSEYGGLNAADLDVISPSLKTFPYDPARMLQTIVRRYHYQDAERTYAFSAGSAEALLERCDELWLHGHVRKLTASDKKRIRAHVEAAERDGKQTIALAYRTLPRNTATDTLTAQKTEQNMVWLGVVTLEHSLRDEVSVALQEAHTAGISVVALATEHATAQVVAHIADMHVTGGKVSRLDSAGLAKLTNKKLAALLHRGGVVLTNLTPEEKLRLVRATQASGRTIAVTGAGLEDMPAFAAADSALALEPASSAQRASDFSLQDPGFGALMVLAEKARSLQVKLRHALSAMLAANLAKLAVIGASLIALTAFDVPVAVALVQLLLLVLVIELIPAIFATRDYHETDEPKAKRHAIPNRVLSRQQLPHLAWAGLLMGALAYANYLLFFARNGTSATIIPADTPAHWKAMTLVVVTLAFCHFANLILHRSHHGITARHQLHNPRFWLSLVGTTVLLWLLVYVPIFSNYLKTLPLTLGDWFFALLAAGIFIGIQEFIRYDRRHHRHHIALLSRSQSVK